jgi:hypothetical protein
MVIFIKPAHQDLQLLSAIMTTFEQIAGLRTNMEKSKATPINCSEEDLQIVTDIFGCAVEAFPCHYLGVPLSIKRLCRSDEQPIIDAISSRIPTWKGNLLNMAGRSTLVAATRSTSPLRCVCRRGQLIASTGAVGPSSGPGHNLLLGANAGWLGAWSPSLRSWEDSALLICADLA